MINRQAALLALLLAGVGATGCGASSHDQAASAAPRDVTIHGYTYAPVSITVAPGTRVTFRNRDATAHTATASGGGFDSGTIAPGKHRTVTFSRIGRYAYICQFHPFMRGLIVVR